MTLTRLRVVCVSRQYGSGGAGVARVLAERLGFRLLDRDLIDESLLPESQRMSRLLQDLLLLARTDEGALGLRREDIDVDDLLAAEALHFQEDGEERRHHSVDEEGDGVEGAHQIGGGKSPDHSCQRRNSE